MNIVILGGGVGKDVEVRYLPSGTAVANISLATNSVRYDKDHVKQEKTEWHDVVCFGKLAENAGKYITKGSQITVQGELQHRSWDGTDGKRHYKTEIVARNVEFMSLKRGNSQADDDLPGKGVDRRLQQRQEAEPEYAQDDPF